MKDTEFLNHCPKCSEPMGNICPSSGAIYCSYCGHSEVIYEMESDDD